MPIAHATGTLTLSLAVDAGAPGPRNGETVTIGGKVYTFQSTLTDVDGNVKIGTYPPDSLENLYNALNLSGTAGTDYAAAMTANPKARAVVLNLTGLGWLRVKALTPGTVGNSVGTTETLANGAWGGATLSGGDGAASTLLAAVAGTDTRSEVVTKLRALIDLITSEGEDNVNVHEAVAEMLRTTNMDSETAGTLHALLCPVEGVS